MKRKYNEFSIWSRREAEYAEELKRVKKEEEATIIVPDQILAPGERYKKARLRLPRIRSEFKLDRMQRSESGVALIFSAGFTIIEYADWNDFSRDRNILNFAFGGGLLDIEIEEDDEE
jgi:hypothetical protein